MKKLVLPFFLFLFSASNAQTETLLQNFEGSTISGLENKYQAKSGLSLTTNIYPDSLNHSTKCGMMNRESGNNLWYILSNFDVTNIEILSGETKYLHMMVHYPVPYGISLRWLKADGTYSLDSRDNYPINTPSVFNKWHDLVFKIVGPVKIEKLMLLYDTWTVLNMTDKIAYVDEIIINDSPNQRIGQNAEIAISNLDTGLVFEGIGAVSAGASSRLLKDYPEKYRNNILDFLFKPNFGASIQHLKFEVGGDVNSTCGTEPSFARTKDEMLNPSLSSLSRGYELWLAQEAKKRNPNILLDILQWGAPGWFEGGFYSQDNADYLASFIKGVKNYLNLDINYCGLWNEKHIPELSRNYVVNYLRPTLNKNGLTNVKIVGNDMYSNSPSTHKPWSYAEELAADDSLRKDIDVLGYHYNNSQSTSLARSLGLPLWESEGAIGIGEWKDALQFARGLNLNLIQAKIVKTIIWNPIDSYYNNVSWNNIGLMEGKTPWCGYYRVRPAVWALAHTTQFVKPGWKYLEKACGVSSGGGSFVTLQNQDRSEFSIIIAGGEVSEKLKFRVSGFSKTTLHVWKSNEKEQFINQNDILITNDTLSFDVSPSTIYSITSTSGQQKGVPEFEIPQRDSFPKNYYEDFESYKINETPRYLSDQGGAFEVKQSDNSNKILEQIITKPLICWDPWGANNPEPYTQFGELNYVNYTISVDVHIKTIGIAKIYGHVTWFESNTGPHGIGLTLDQNGYWQFIVDQKAISTGNIIIDVKNWQNLKLEFYNGKVKGYINNNLVLINSIDSKFPYGFVGIGCNWNEVQFDNLKFIYNENILSNNISEKTSNSFKIYPNPVKNIINVNLTNPQSENLIKITDVSGKQILNRRLNQSESSISLDISSLKKGLYSISVDNLSGKHTQKLMVE